MRQVVKGLAILLAAATGALAQTTPAPKVENKADTARLDAHLASWEKKMRDVTTLSAALTRTDKDKVFRATSKFAGTAQYMKSGTGATALNLAVLELKPDGKNDISEKLVCTGTYLYQYAPAQKEIRAYEMPRPKPGQVSDDGFLGLLFGMKAEDAKKRYTLTMSKEDQWYVYVDIVPRDKEDKADFARARLVLNKDTYLPRQLWFEHSNGNEVLWDIPSLKTGVSIDRKTFDAPKPPAGWKLIPVNRDNKTPQPQPRVIRPNQ